MTGVEPPNIFDRSLAVRRRERALARGSVPRFLLDRVADDLCDRLQFINRPFEDVLVLGGHDGSIGRRLRELSRVRNVVETEASLRLAGMLGLGAVVADEEALPFGRETFDLVVAPLTLHTVNDLPGALVQIRHVLRPDGLFLGAMAGGATLQELRASWLQAEADLLGGVSPRVAPFADVRDMGRLLQRAGFALPVADSDIVTVRYGTAFDLMSDIRAMGQSNLLSERRRTPVTRGLLARASEVYTEAFAQADGRVPATFEILTLTAWAPHDSQPKPLKPGSATVSLAEALGTRENSIPGSRTRSPDGADES
ncbi:MAG: methyltransferase domain-containing protein [Hyphomicrobium sp.]|nr:methyltransferase domain-containing protein [Hyphomicrobium sp.]